MTASLSSFRASSRRLGQYSRMLDLGGVPPAKTGNLRPADASKNCKIRAVAFDFDLLTGSMDKIGPRETQQQQQPKTTITTNVLPDMSLVENMANLLNVNLGGTKKEGIIKDDLSALTGDDVSNTKNTTVKHKDKKDDSFAAVDFRDVRSKYAAKLRNKVGGRGGGGLESAHQERQDALTKGDASSHLAARAASVSSPSSAKWLASTGTGNLLTYVSNRSIRVALLPIPKNTHASEEGVRMQDFTKQLANLVSVDLMIREGDNATRVLKNVLSELKIPPETIMVVSNRDDYLKAAKEASMLACLIRPENARRGNVTAHFHVPTMADVQEVINEMNGISFNAIISS